MSQANLKLRLTFDFELAVPPEQLAAEHEALCARLHETLGAMVIQGLPTIAGKQLAKAGIDITAHHHHLDAVNLSAPALPHATLAAAAPHLTDDELTLLARRASGKLPGGEDERQRFLRRQALAMINEYRMVPCVVEARLSNGTPARLEGRLNLTNGCVLLGERDRQNKLQTGAAAIAVIAADGHARMSAECAGHTLSGPVIEVPVAAIAAHRDPLIRAWQQLEG